MVGQAGPMIFGLMATIAGIGLIGKLLKMLIS
jgi:hypothetical protein